MIVQTSLYQHSMAFTDPVPTIAALYSLYPQTIAPYQSWNGESSQLAPRPNQGVGRAEYKPRPNPDISLDPNDTLLVQ
jgi:hypothetical protein